jgi:hypothetical protein
VVSLDRGASKKLARYRFRELEQTRDYVELYDPDRQITARIYDNQFFAHGPGESDWTAGLHGYWAR